MSSLYSWEVGGTYSRPNDTEDDGLEKRLETETARRSTVDVRVYSVEAAIGFGRASFGRLGSRPSPAAFSDSSIVYAGSFSCFSRRLWIFDFQCDLRAGSVSKYLWTRGISARPKSERGVYLAHSTQ